MSSGPSTPDSPSGKKTEDADELSTSDFNGIFKDAFKERLANPAVSAFVISWVVCNWRTILLVALARPTTRESLATICNNELDWNHALLWPALGALSYILLSPIVYLLIHRYQTYFRSHNQKWSATMAKAVKAHEMGLADDLDKEAVKRERSRVARRLNGVD